jgi:hypothetical protein
MLRWLAFGAGALLWIAVCWFFASMVAGTAAGPKAAIAQDACAKRLMIEAQQQGRTLDRMDALFDPRCKREHDRQFAELTRPYLRNGLLIGVLPVLLAGLLMLRGRG